MRRAFTLLELIIVVVILAVLAVVGVAIFGAAKYGPEAYQKLTETTIPNTTLPSGAWDAVKTSVTAQLPPESGITFAALTTAHVKEMQGDKWLINLAEVEIQNLADLKVPSVKKKFVCAVARAGDEYLVSGLQFEEPTASLPAESGKK